MMVIWYADDSVVLEHDINRLRWLIDVLVRLLRDIGLLINVHKTKLMVVAKWNAHAHVQQPVDYILIVGDITISLVEEFWNSHTWALC